MRQMYWWQVSILAVFLGGLGCQAILPDLEVTEGETETSDSGTADTGTGADTDTGSDSASVSGETDSMTDSVAGSDSDSVAEDETDDTATGPVSPLDSDSDTVVPDSDTTGDSGGVADTETWTDSDSGSDAGGDTSDTGPGPDSESASDSGAGDVTDTEVIDTDFIPTDDCSDRADFTPCTAAAASSARSYNICISGVCESPGCDSVKCNPPGPHFPLADTGVLRCYSNSADSTSCEVIDAAFDGQDAQFGWDVTSGSAPRFTRNTDSPEYPIVTDNVTGLMWQGCIAGLTGAYCNSDIGGDQLYWRDAVKLCDELEWGPYTDWHLPDAYELASMMDYGRYQPATDPDVFPGTPGTGNMWTISVYPLTANTRWGVSLTSGNVYTPGLNDDNARALVRCVRGGAASRPVFRFSRSTVGGQALVADSVTGLMWPGCHVVEPTAGSLQCAGAAATPGITWQAALAFCAALTWGGEDDWRLPNVKEMQSIVDYRTYSPSVNNTVFASMPSTRFWTSSTRTDVATYAWYVSTHIGAVGNAAKTAVSSLEGGIPQQHVAMCVRGPQ